MQIQRNNNSIIQKKQIEFTKLDIFDEKKIILANKILKDTINNTFVSHFDYISYSLKYFDEEFSKYNENIGCVSDCIKLKKELKKIGLKTYFVTCKTNGFLNPKGDDLVKEAHTFLIYPCLKNNKLYFTIFDPGFRINQTISFYDLCDSTSILFLTGKAKVSYNNNFFYPYKLSLDRRINYKREIGFANINWEFNPYYETLNILNYAEELYPAIFSLKLMNYPADINKYLCIRSKILENTIEIYSIFFNKIYNLDDLKILDKKDIEILFKSHFINANIDIDKFNRFIKNINILINNKNAYIEKVLDKDVVKEYKLGKKLNR